ncbi:MAG TPA: hypothetical protein VMK05_09580 [Burkholderiales bacterium]|nr:hypothetical protein [Burkholderiales bacterium]
MSRDGAGVPDVPMRPLVRGGAVALAAVLGALCAAPAQAADAARGSLLYDNNCVVCHTPKVHHREPPLPIDVADLRRIVASWAREQKLGWTDDDVSDVVEYLYQTHYTGRLR